MDSTDTADSAGSGRCGNRQTADALQCTLPTGTRSLVVKAFNQPVKVESFSGEWKAFGPRISLQGVSLMPDGEQPEIAINRAALDIKPLNALIPGRPLYSFRIIGADLALERTSDGRYVLSGLGVSNAGASSKSSPRFA